ncbi:DUF7577 domain-containing protein [Haloarcula sp. GH36]|uniref:DUF7577 domain-containing protein n=1 Tax=Haloarcula montana TaxID=3111776 RepID=UPI002D78F9B3|nr:zinc ribbon domain-containing protein [Haloarcula sp. GH36]
MVGTEWLYGAIALLVGIHVLTMLYAYRSRDETATTESEGEQTQPLGGRGERVDCPQCGTTNDPNYRFCRTCVADLSKQAPQRQPTGGSHPH